VEQSKSNPTPKQEERDVSRQSKLWVLAAAAVFALSGTVAACGGDDDDNGGSSGGGGGSKPKVAVLLPDTKSSTRWEQVDRPLLQKALTDGGLDPTVVNAQGDKSTQQQQAEQAITNGAKVLLLVNLDSGSGAAIEANAKAQGLKVIDYDRLTLDTDANDYYVSFDNVEVGKLQGQGLVDCLGNKKGARIAELNGSPTDNNATLFKQGYDSVLKPKYASGDYVKVDDQSVPDWDNQKALTIFEQILEKNSNKVDGVLAANDGLGNAAISALKQRKLPQIPVTGQDATLEGLQNIVNGDQCMTVYKAIQKEVDAAADLAVALANGKTPTAKTTPVDNGKHKVPSVLETPVAVTKDNISQYFGAPDYPKRDDICAGKVAANCKKIGL
jgi:D-xylose transport system substrate-binding protein